MGEVVRALKDPGDAHHYEQLAVEDLGKDLIICSEQKYFNDFKEILRHHREILQ